MKTINLTTEIPTPQFMDLKFKSKEAMFKWLKKTASRKLDFVDTGRDMYQIWIHESGEILHSNAQTGIWVGKFVDLNQIEVGMHVRMTLDNQWRQMKGLIVEQIHKLN